MKSTYLLLAFLTLCNGLLRPVPPETANVSIEKRFRFSHGVLNATPLRKSRFDSLVSVQKGDDSRHLCAGVLLDLDFVLIPASCLVIQNSGFYEPKDVQGDGVTFLNAEKRTVKRIFMHNAFDTTYFTNDVAILEIDPFENDRLGDVLIALEGPVLYQNCFAYGWGVDDDLDTLRAYNMSVEISDKCEQHFGLAERSLCVLGRNTCLNGAGNLLFCNGELTGILSFGYACDMTEVPNVYTDLSKYNEWIEGILKDAIYSTWDSSYKKFQVTTSRISDACSEQSLSNLMSEVFCEEYVKNCMPQIPKSTSNWCKRGVSPYFCQYVVRPESNPSLDASLKSWFTSYYSQLRTFQAIRHQQEEFIRQIQGAFFVPSAGNLVTETTDCNFKQKFNQIAELCGLKPLLSVEMCDLCPERNK